MFIARLFSLTLIVLIAASAVAQEKAKKANKGNKGNKGDKDGVDDVVGAIWHYRLTRNGKTESGNFRVYQFEIFKGKEKIGSVKPKDDDETTLTITGFPELNGKATLHKVRDKTRLAKGTLVRPDGEKWEMEVEVKDR
jgi:hypothetical protein